MSTCPSCGAATPDGARFCPECGFVLAGARPQTGLRKVVTIVFCDLCDSTKLGEALDPETLRQVIAQYFRSVSAVLERHEAVIEKYIGDAVMAVFGAPGDRVRRRDVAVDRDAADEVRRSGWARS